MHMRGQPSEKDVWVFVSSVLKSVKDRSGDGWSDTFQLWVPETITNTSAEQAAQAKSHHNIDLSSN